MRKRNAADARKLRRLWAEARQLIAAINKGQDEVDKLQLTLRANLTDEDLSDPEVVKLLAMLDELKAMDLRG